MSDRASSLSYYQKGAWALHFVRETIGAKAFQKAVKTYLKKYKYQNVETNQFLAEVKKAAPAFDTASFQKIWLEDYRFPTDIANGLLKKNKFMQTLFEVQQLRKNPLDSNRARFAELLRSDVFYPVKTEIIYQLKEIRHSDKLDLLLLAMQTNEFTDEIALDFKGRYESFLDDKSYDTREIAFMKLWKSFPNDRAKYLEKAKDWTGNNDKGLRVLYLMSYLSYADSREQNCDACLAMYSELIRYTSPQYEASVRQNALLNVLTISKENKEVLKNLVNATTHYRWQFSKFGRDKIRELLRQDGYRSLFQSLLPELKTDEKAQLQRLLDEKI
jgi:aminopeptidase N